MAPRMPSIIMPSRKEEIMIPVIVARVYFKKFRIALSLLYRHDLFLFCKYTQTA